MKITTGTTTLHVEQRGAGSPALVFLHYWGGSTRTWRHVIDALATDHRTVAIDQRGWGQSQVPVDGHTLADMADDAQAVIEALALEHYVLVGHSMGGKVAQLLASRRPRGLIGLVLVAPAPPSAMAFPLPVRQAMVHAYDTRESIVATIEQVLAPGGLAPQDLETVVADSLLGTAAARQAWPMMSSQEDITAAMADIDVPVIVISGEHDRVDPPDALRRELLSRIAQAQLLELANVGHLLPLEAPVRVADIIKAFVHGVTGDGVCLPATGGDVALSRCADCGVPRLVTVASNREDEA